MTLTTHALVGAAAASLFPEQPIIAFAAGFASHLAIDAIPHWDYDGYLLSLKKNKMNPLETDMNLQGKPFLQDITIIAADAIFGLLLSLFIFSFLLFHVPFWIVAIGACSGILPDPLQFVYWKTRTKTKILEPLQQFHIWLQVGKTLKVAPWVGIGLQCFLVVTVCIILKLII